MKVIDFNSVWEKYRIKFIQQKNVCWEEVWVLEDINFKAEKGDIVGIIGKNGAGKTTLLKLIAGMLVPDKGEIYIKGKVSALMELGAGFNPEFTGIENISLNAAIYGLSEADLKQRMGDIIEFAGLDKFINAPIKYYSQGMYMRLAFALAIYVEPDILLIDDILAVGDEEAQRKCIKKIFELKKAGKTIILVSHDMNMVSKLCNRLILLEKGKIVQEGGTAKVSSYYLETVGDEKGIAVLEKEGLRVIFNNGKVTLDYNGFSFTKAIGGYASLFMSSLNSWSSSFNLSWEVKNFGTDKIIAEGKSYEGVLSQIWTLQIEKNCLQWQTEIREEGIKQPHIDLLLIPQYKRWQTLDKISDFPLFASKSNWQDLGLNSCSDAVLGVSTVWQNQDCPGLIFEQEDKDISFKLFNTGYEQEARVIQWESGLKNKNRISIKIFPKKEKFTEYIENAKQKLLFEQQAELVRLRAQHTISCGGLRLYADVKEKSLRLYYKDKEITKGEGLHNSFLVNNVWYTLSSGVWQIKNVSEKELNLILNYETLPLFQIWTLICKEDTLMVKIEVKFNKPISVSNQLTLLQVHDGYKKWESVYEHGNLLNERFINDIVPVRLKDNKISKILLKSKNNEDIPELSFNVFSQLDKRTMNIYKYKRKNDKGICLNSSLTIFKKERLIKPGKYTYFEGEIILGKTAKIEKIVKKVSTVELNNKCLKFVFKQGKGSIFLKEKELTFGLGVYTSVRSSGIWYDSYQALWQIIESGKSKIAAVGDWPHIPISQTWQLELIEKNLIYWKVEMEMYEKVNLEIEQANLMLPSEYKTWLIPGVSKGEFLDEYTRDYDILPFRFWYGKAPKGGIGVVNKNLPCVSFKCNLENNRYRAIIENTDNLYQARLLQYQRSNTDKISPKKYIYFEGVIKIESQI